MKTTRLSKCLASAALTISIPAAVQMAQAANTWSRWVQNPPTVPVIVSIPTLAAESNTTVQITLADGLVTAYGDTNGCSTVTNGPSLFANLNVHREYLLTVIATNLQQISMSLDVKPPWQLLGRTGSDSVPKGYITLINRNPGNTISDSTNCTYYSNSWTVEIRDQQGARWIVDDQSNDPKPAPGDGSFLQIGPAKSLFTNRISIEWSAGLGRLYDGLAAGRLRLSESSLSRETYTPKGIFYSAPSTNARSEIQLISAQTDGSLRQVYAFQCFVDVIDPWTFCVADITNLTSLASRLKTETNGVSPYVSNHLASATQIALTNYQGSGSSPEPLQSLLVHDFNALISGPSIYDTNRFTNVTLRAETRFLVGQNPTGADLLRLNRLLLEDAYPTQLVQRPYQTSLAFYQLNQIGPGTNQDGVYTNITGTPYVTWSIQDPQPIATTNILVIESRNGVNFTNSLTYNPTAGSDNWSLVSGAGAEQKIEARAIAFLTGTTTNRFETNTIRSASNSTNAYKCVETYQLFPWGWELVQTQVDPDSANLTTSFEFYTDTNNIFTFGNPSILRYPDGYWEVRLYNVGDWWIPLGVLEYVLRPFNGQPVDPTAADPYNCDVTYYSGYWHDDQSTYRITEHHITDPSYNASPYEQIGTYASGTFIQEVDGRRHWNYGGHQIGHSVFRGSDAMGRGLQSHEFSIIDSTGPHQAMYYKGGTFNPATLTFTTNATGVADGPDWQKAIVKWGVPDGSAFDAPLISVDTIDGEAVWDGNGYQGILLSPFQSTRESTTFQFASPVFRQLSVFTGVLDTNNNPVFETYQSFNYKNDSLGHTTNITLIDAHNPNITRIVYEANFQDANGKDGELLRWETDETGLQKQYQYDSLKRVTQISRIGLTNAVASIPTLSTNSTYDAYGRTILQTVNGSTLWSTNRWSFDTAGRLLVQTTPDGLVSSYSYSSGGTVVSTTLPNGTTMVREQYIDRRLKSITGTGTKSEFHTYSVNLGGGSDITNWCVYQKELINWGSSNSPRWSLTGWMYLEELPILKMAPDYDPANFVYEKKMYGFWLGLPITVSTSGKDQTVYNMDFSGQPVEIGTPGAGPFVANTSRITASTHFYRKDGAGNWFFAETNLILLEDNSAATTIKSVNQRRLSGFASGSVMSEVTSWDADTNATIVTTYVDRAAKQLTKTTDPASSSLNATNITVLGLLIKESTPSVSTLTVHTYDALGRETGITTPLGFMSSRTYNQFGQIISETDLTKRRTDYDYYPNGVLGAGKTKTATRADGTKTYYGYTARDEVFRIWGDVPYPQERVYSPYGELVQLHTFEGGSNWSSSSWPAVTGATNVTTWIYQEHSGLLTNKTDSSGRSVAYAYVNGMLTTNIFARGVSASRTYNEFGDLTEIDYSDGTPSVSFQDFNRAGLPRTIVDGNGTSVLTYDYANRLISCAGQSGGVYAGIVLSNVFNPVFGRGDLFVQNSNTTVLHHSFGFDTFGRIASVSSGTYSGTYAYAPNSDLLLATTCKSGGSTSMTATCSWDFGSRLRSIANVANGTTVASFNYLYDNLGRRFQATLEDGSIWRFDHNNRDELTAGKRYWADWTPVAGEQFEYAYDNLGNRISTREGGDANGANLRTANCVVNNINECTNRTVLGQDKADIIGNAYSTASVTVNGNSAYRKGEYYQFALSVNNGSGPVWQGVTNKATQGSSSETNIGNVLIAPATQSLQYDLDGNLTNDSVWVYIWDAENRLIQMTNTTTVPTTARKKLVFTYDYLGRRSTKAVYDWATSDYSTNTSSSTISVYDGLRLIAEFNPSHLALRTYLWGKDISGTDQAAGIGGLVMFTALTSPPTNCFAGCDGNGNVVALVNASTGTLDSRYEYEPYGRVLRQTGSASRQNPFGFSTKFRDSETGLLYFGYRYYAPASGKWINRDQAEEPGGVNLYLFCLNSPCDKFDTDGRWPTTLAAWNYWGNLADYTGMAYNLATVAGLFPDSASAGSTLLYTAIAATMRINNAMSGALLKNIGGSISFGAVALTGKAIGQSWGYAIVSGRLAAIAAVGQAAGNIMAGTAPSSTTSTAGLAYSFVQNARRGDTAYADLDAALLGLSISIDNVNPFAGASGAISVTSLLVSMLTGDVAGMAADLPNYTALNAWDMLSEIEPNL